MSRSQGKRERRGEEAGRVMRVKEEGREGRKDDWLE